jgi:hypothetical protein
MGIGNQHVWRIRAHGSGRGSITLKALLFVASLLSAFAVSPEVRELPPPKS